jgi:deoxyribodipyrimidine photolyase-related protein
MVNSLRVVLGDQLSRGVSSLDGIEPGDVVLMMEVAEETAYVGHHKQKIVLFLSAMRHFADNLRAEGIAVDYMLLDAEGNTGSFTEELARAVARHRPARVIATEPGEWRVARAMAAWHDRLEIKVELRPDTRFFASHRRFIDWAQGRSQWRMEHFYRELRRETRILMEGDSPAGGEWNYDNENRKRLPRGKEPTRRRRFPPDATTRAVMDMVEARFPENFGTLDAFDWPVCREDALAALDDFIAHGLPEFGDYQDAMKAGAPFLYHSLLSPALNLGLVTPRELCDTVEAAWREGRAPLNAVEGFIRQILGWREYVRGVYWSSMPDYAEENRLSARRPLPAFYWTGETDMRCLAEAIGQTRDHAYSHHIQRLMLTGNFALLAGVAPREIERWYLAVYADALEWVEMPNTLGMAVFADGGRMASKPYAASGAYIDRMSDFCRGCAYDVKKKVGQGACPFNALYWAFLIRNRKTLEGNPRLAMPYRTLRGWDEARRAAYAAQAEAFLDGLEPWGWSR